jgi:hypothetical protein
VLRRFGAALINICAKVRNNYEKCKKMRKNQLFRIFLPEKFAGSKKVRTFATLSARKGV